MIRRHAEEAARLLADLIAAQNLPAIELMRELDYTTIYSMPEFRAWPRG